MLLTEYLKRTGQRVPDIFQPDFKNMKCEFQTKLKGEGFDYFAIIFVCFGFEIVSHRIPLAILKLAVYTRLTLSLQRLTC